MSGKVTQTPRQQTSYVAVYDSVGFQGGEVIAANPATVLGVTATNKGATVAYVQLFDSTSAPTGVPTYTPIAVPPATTVAISFNDVHDKGSTGLTFSKGLVWGASSTAATYTADSTDVSCQVRFIQ